MNCRMGCGRPALFEDRYCGRCRVEVDRMERSSVPDPYRSRIVIRSDQIPKGKVSMKVRVVSDPSIIQKIGRSLSMIRGIVLPKGPRDPHGSVRGRW